MDHVEPRVIRWITIHFHNIENAILPRRSKIDLKSRRDRWFVDVERILMAARKENPLYRASVVGFSTFAQISRRLIPVDLSLHDGPISLGSSRISLSNLICEIMATTAREIT
jgi:hypothetical protein